MTRTTWHGAPRRWRVGSSASSSSSAAGTASTWSACAPFARAPSVPLQVDVNEWWSLAEASEAIPQLAELGVAYVEQPLPAGDAGAEELKARSPIPIYVDEDCHTLADVARCGEIAHGINIKLAKSGGIREGIRMAHAARALGLGVMLGCMVESGTRDRGRMRRRTALRSRRSRWEPPARGRSLPGSDIQGRRAGAVRGTRPRCRVALRDGC